MTVTFAPPGRVSGQRVRPKAPAPADHDRYDAPNGQTRTVRGVTLPQVPVPVFDDSDALITASLPEDLNRFGEGATAAALELAGRDSTTKDVIP